MSDYVRVYNLTVKDSLPTGDSGKVIKGTELDVELNAVAAAVSSKADINSPTFTGTPAAPTATYGTSTTQLATTAFVQQALQALYPVGSIYTNAGVSTNPATLLGFGTWTAFGEGKVLVGLNASDTLFDTLEETGGSKDAVVVQHNHTATSTSTSSSSSSVSDPGHSHSYDRSAENAGSRYTDHSGQDTYEGYVSQTSGSNTTGISVSTSTTTSTSTSVANSGVSGTNANIQPYIVVKMWKRTA